MSLHLARPRSLALVLAPALGSAALAPARPALATPRGGVDPRAQLSADGRTATVTGTVDCSQAGGRPVMLRITLTQAATDAVAEGVWQRSCTDANQSWSLALSVGGDRTLTADAADVAVLDLTDAVQWIGQTQLVAGP